MTIFEKLVVNFDYLCLYIVIGGDFARREASLLFNAVAKLDGDVVGNNVKERYD